MYGVCFTHSVGIYTLPLFFGGSYQNYQGEMGSATWEWISSTFRERVVCSSNVPFVLLRSQFRMSDVSVCCREFCWVYLPVEWGEKMKVLPSQTDPSYPLHAPDLASKTRHPHVFHEFCLTLINPKRYMN